MIVQYSPHKYFYTFLISLVTLLIITKCSNAFSSYSNIAGNKFVAWTKKSNTKNHMVLRMIGGMGGIQDRYYSSEYTKHKGIRLPLLVIDKEEMLKADTTTLSDEKTLIDLENQGIVPLPSSHLPVELSTLNLYGVSFSSPSRKRLIEEAKTTTLRADGENKSFNDKPGFYGHVILDDDNKNSLVGSVGCAVEILIIQQQQQPESEDNLSADNDDSFDEEDDDTKVSSKDNTLANELPMVCLTRGSFRFIVREIVSSFPYPVAIVDELLDDEEEETYELATVEQNNDNEEATMMYSDFGPDATNNEGTIFYSDFEEDSFSLSLDESLDNAVMTEQNYFGITDEYRSISADELPSRTLQAMQTYIQLMLNKPPPTLLEQSIIEEFTQSPIDSTASTAEEMAAIFEVFRQELVEINSPSARRFAIGFLAAEIGSLDQEKRLNLLKTRNSNTRLRIVLQDLNSKIDSERRENSGMSQPYPQEPPKTSFGFEDTNTDISASNPLSSSQPSSSSSSSSDFSVGGNIGKDLKVGKPELPPWASRIKKGMDLEYYWNDEFGWCPGTVLDVVKVLDEVIITFEFEADGEVHKLPVTAEEKIRWRPKQ